MEYINTELKKLYGTDIVGNPRFRLVWSDRQFEHRKGTFAEYHGPIYLGTFTGVKKVPKYNYIKERWILELQVPKKPSEELPNPDGYECLYVFESAKGEYLEPKLNVCKIIIYHFLNPDMNYLQRKELFEMLDKKEFEKDVAYFKDMFEEASPHLATMLSVGEAVTAPKIKEDECKTN